MPVSRRTYDDLHARYVAQVDKTAEAEKDRAGTLAVAARIQHQHDVLARVVAVHIVVAEEHGVEISPGTLRAALQRARLDLSIEYDRASRDGATP